MADEVQFHSVDEIRAYIKMELERQLALQQKEIYRWRLAKQTTWLLLLVAGYLQFFLFDIMYQQLSLPTLQVNVPLAKHPPANPPKTRT